MPHSIGRLSVSASSHHSLSLAAFITNIAGSDFRYTQVWLIEELKKEGHELKAGDLISVGSFSPLAPPKAGQTVAVRYEGLAQPASVRVTFQ